MVDRPKFDYSAFPPGFYQEVIDGGNPVRAAWHLQKFRRVIHCLPQKENQSILDVGCFAGSFLALIDQAQFSRQVGVDILQNQVDYASARFGTDFRSFQCAESMASIDFPGQSFDCVTLIEVLEHLSIIEASTFLQKATHILKPNGKLVVTTPNYASMWPLLEMLINRFSDVSYEEQHITKFNYFTVGRTLRKLFPDFDQFFAVDFVTTTHFMAPFLAAISPEWSNQISLAVDHKKWRFPFGNLILMSLTRK